MKQPFIQYAFHRPGTVKLEARVKAAEGTARHGKWLWLVCEKRDRRKVVAKCRRSYLRKYGAVRGARRAFPTAEVVIVASSAAAE